MGHRGDRSARGVSEAASQVSDDSQPSRPNTRGKGKRNSGAATNAGRRKADEPPAKAPASKKAKTNGGAPATRFEVSPSSPEEEEDDDDGKDGPKSKMTDEEKRKNFLERNR